jgi:hypothetical protein
MKNLVHMFMCSADEESGTCLCVVLMKNLVHMFMCSADEESGTYVYV